MSSPQCAILRLRLRSIRINLKSSKNISTYDHTGEPLRALLRMLCAVAGLIDILRSISTKRPASPLVLNCWRVGQSMALSQRGSTSLRCPCSLQRRRIPWQRTCLRKACSVYSLRITWHCEPRIRPTISAFSWLIRFCWNFSKLQFLCTTRLGSEIATFSISRRQKRLERQVKLSRDSAIRALTLN